MTISGSPGGINYPKTPANEDALIVLIQSYDKPQMPQLRDDARRVLKETFPNGKNFAVRTRPWWQFWTKDELPPPSVDEAKPWWKFW